MIETSARVPFRSGDGLKLPAATPTLRATNLGARVGERWLFRGLDLALQPGRIGAVLGPNGVGKTTLLRTLLGRRRPDEGGVVRPSPLGYVPQRSETAFAYRALDMVVMGRARHIGRLSSPGSLDRTIARAALDRVGIVHLALRTFDTLSGGERQLVLIARALASEPSVLLLDEPASALDLKNQARLLALLGTLGEGGERTILFTTHDPNHALAAADDALLMMPHGEALFGAVEDVITPDALERLYGVPMRSVPVANTARGHAVVPVFG